MAAGPGGTLLVSIPALTGSVLALLDRDGTPLPGWPIAMEDPCTGLFPVEDGSVRVVCRGAIFETSEEVRAYAFDAGGRPLAGWPVTIERGMNVTGRAIGNELTLAVGRYDNVPKMSMQTIAPDGMIRRGTEVATECCYGWSVAPDGIAYGTASAAEPPHDNRITAVGPDGELAGWPVQIEGRASGPAVGVGGRIVVAVGPHLGGSTGVLAFDRDLKPASAAADVPIRTVNPLGTGDVDCGNGYVPPPPIVSDNGTIFVYSELERSVFALEPSLATKPGWPFDPATGLQYRSYLDPRSELSCGSSASPAVGPDGRERTGWPVVLQRHGAEFWSVAVGSDGIVFALAIEPETADTFSASILAIAPDSTVLYATTIIDP